jgi:uncharacterized protein YdcH (DUF465 family)/uncharacterized coiled-coil DUF342 family protein
MASDRRDGFNIPPPDRSELDANIQQIRQKIDKITAKLEALNVQDTKNSAVDQFQEERRKIQQTMDTLRTSVDALKKVQEQRRSRIKQIDEVKGTLRKRGTELSKNGPATAAEIDAEISRLELRLETEGHSSLKREKAIAGDIQRLRLSKTTIRERDTLQQEQGSLDDERKKLMDEVLDTQKEMERLRAERETHYAQLQEIVERQTKSKDAIGEIRKERQLLRTEIRGCLDEISKLRDDFTARGDAWRKQRDEAREKEREKREAERKVREEQRAKQLEERRQREKLRARVHWEAARVKRLNPHEQEIAVCDSLIAFLLADAKEQEKKRSVAEFDPKAYAKKGMQVLKKDAAEEDLWLMGKKKAKPPAEAKAAAASPPPLPPKPKADRKLPALTLPRLQGFNTLGVTPPIRSSDIPACLELLKAKKAHFESLKRTPAELDREDAEAVERRKAEQAKRLEAGSSNRLAVKEEGEPAAEEATGAGEAEAALEPEVDEEDHGEADATLAQDAAQATWEADEKAALAAALSAEEQEEVEAEAAGEEEATAEPPPLSDAGEAAPELEDEADGEPDEPETAAEGGAPPRNPDAPTGEASAEEAEGD